MASVKKKASAAKRKNEDARAPHVVAMTYFLFGLAIVFMIIAVLKFN